MNRELRGAKANGSHGKHSWRAVATGAAGAATVTLAHEIVRQLVPHPPRMDKIGMSALTKLLRAAGLPVPRGERLRGYTLIGDLATSGLFYAPLALSGKRPWLRGLLLGTAAGVGAVVLTPMLGLPRRDRGTTLRTQAMTVALYAVGGLVAGMMASLLHRPTRAHAVAVSGTPRDAQG